MKTQGNRENPLPPCALWGLTGRDGEEEEPLASVVFPPSTIAKQCMKRHAATQASHWSLWLPSMLSRLENGYIHAQAPRIVEPTRTVNRSTEFEVTTSLRRNTVCTNVIVGYVVKMKRRLCVSVQCAGCYFFLRNWERRRRSEIGCYSTRRGAAFHCIAWEMFEHWRKTNRWVRVWEFFVMNWLGLISLEKNLNEKTSAYMIKREHGEQGSSSSSEESRVLACAIFFLDFFVETRSIMT